MIPKMKNPDKRYSLVPGFFGFLSKIISRQGRNEPVFVFGQLNHKTLSIAKSIANEKDRRIIFAGLAPGHEQRSVLRSIGAEFLSKDVADVLKHFMEINNPEPVEVFLFGECDEKNIADLSSIADVVKHAFTGHLRVYVELERTSQAVQDSISKNYRHLDRMIINFVRTPEDFAYNNLYDNLMIENALEENGRKVIRTLVIGSDAISMETVKCMLWLAQIPGYRIEITIVSDAEFVSRFKYSCPEIKDEADEPGMAVYRLKMHQNISYDGDEFARLITKYSGFTFAFVNSGNDMANCNIAADLCMCRKRAGIEDDCMILVRNNTASGVFENSDELWKNVKIVGTEDDLYSYSYLTNSPIENAARLIHDKRQTKKDLSKRVAWSDYCRDEYKRKSVFARALSLRYRLYIISQDYHAQYCLLQNDDTWMMYEHMRWNVYMQAGGFIHSDKKDTGIGRTHPDILPFNRLDRDTQLNDAIAVDDDIVNSLLKKRWTKGRFVSEECNKFRIADAAEFVRFFEESHDELIGAKHCFVDSHTENELYGTTRIMFLDEHDIPEAYVAVNCKNGNIGSVMKDRDSSKRGFIADMLYTATEYNGSKLDCYDDSRSTLPKCYSMAGFMPVCRIRFDETQVSPGWVPEAGKPDIVFMFFMDPGIDYDTYRQKVLSSGYMAYDKYAYVPYVDVFPEWALSRGFSDDYSFAWFIRDYVQNLWMEKRDIYKGRENEFVKEMIADRY